MKSTTDNFGMVERSETLTEQTYRRLRHALMTGKLPPGEKVTGRRIAKALDVSLTPAREAIGRLVAEGGLAPGRNQAALVPRLTKASYKEIIKIRLLLEGLAAENSVPNFDAKKISELESIQKDIEHYTDQKEYLTVQQRNADFHFLIYRTSEMPTLMSLIDAMWLRTGPTMSLLAPEYQISRQGSRNHLDALEAIRSGDAKALRRAIVKDLKDGTRFLVPLLAEN